MKRALQARGAESSKKAKLSSGGLAGAPAAAEPRGFILRYQNEALVANFRTTQRALREKDAALAALRTDASRKCVLAAAVDRTWHQLTASLETIVAEAGVAASGADADAAAVDTSVTRLLGGYGDGTTDAAAGSEGQDEDDEDDEDQPTPDPSEVEFQSALDARREAAERLLRTVCSAVVARGGAAGAVPAAAGPSAAATAAARSRFTGRIVRLEARLAAARAQIATLEEQRARRTREERDADRAWARSASAVDAALRADASAARAAIAPPSAAGSASVLSSVAADALSAQLDAALHRATKVEAELDALRPASRASESRLVEIQRLRDDKSAVETELARLRLRPPAAFDESRVVTCAPYLQLQENLRSLQQQLAQKGRDTTEVIAKLANTVAEKTATLAALQANLTSLQTTYAAMSAASVESESACRRAVAAAKDEVQVAEAEAEAAGVAAEAAKSYSAANVRLTEQLKVSQSQLKRLEGKSEVDQDALVAEVTSMLETADAAQTENAALRAQISAGAAALLEEKKESSKWRMQHDKVTEEQTRIGMKLKTATDLGSTRAALLENKEKQMVAATAELEEQVKARESEKRTFEQSKGEHERLSAAKVIAETAQSEAEAQLRGAKTEVGRYVAEAERARHELARAEERCNDMQMQLDSIASSGGAAGIAKAESQAKQLRELRNVLKCPIDPTGELRDTALKTCGHVFCRKVIDGLVESRSRKCPLCGVKFDKNDILKIWLWRN